ncbi:hypothetical protein ARMGADRAFT_1018446 [Armillaria gallica]|uniref:Uncharacterized protein n=1 Tax=Armillaria gallica TaxID=47427 RepID=A0A2H3CSD5_ARMGA|nr:hypothetical protein ARMGADRAFT_1018446 [Armillaria gallica]
MDPNKRQSRAIVKYEPTFMASEFCLHHFPSRCSMHGFPNSRPPQLAVSILAGQTSTQCEQALVPCCGPPGSCRCLRGPFRRSLFVRTMVSP